MWEGASTKLFSEKGGTLCSTCLTNQSDTGWIEKKYSNSGAHRKQSLENNGGEIFPILLLSPAALAFRITRLRAHHQERKPSTDNRITIPVGRKKIDTTFLNTNRISILWIPLERTETTCNRVGKRF